MVHLHMRPIGSLHSDTQGDKAELNLDGRFSWEMQENRERERPCTRAWLNLSPSSCPDVIREKYWSIFMVYLLNINHN